MHKNVLKGFRLELAKLGALSGALFEDKRGTLMKKIQDKKDKDFMALGGGRVSGGSNYQGSEQTENPHRNLRGHRGWADNNSQEPISELNS